MTAHPYARLKSVGDIAKCLPTRFTQEQVSKMLNVTRRRVGQIEREALWKIQKRMNEQCRGETSI
jgi:DNA-directed RNA polymerase sigma subunit (sigma70/sigma32)